MLARHNHNQPNHTVVPQHETLYNLFCHRCWVNKRSDLCVRLAAYLTVQHALFLGMLRFFGLGQQRIKTVYQLLLTRLLVFTLQQKTTTTSKQQVHTPALEGLHDCVSVVCSREVLRLMFEQNINTFRRDNINSDQIQTQNLIKCWNPDFRSFHDTNIRF